MAEEERRIQRIISITPEADQAMQEAAESLGISYDDGANNAFLSFSDLTDLGVGAGKGLLIVDLETLSIEGGVEMSPRAFNPVDNPDVVPLRRRPNLGKTT